MDCHQGPRAPAETRANYEDTAATADFRLHVDIHVYEIHFDGSGAICNFDLVPISVHSMRDFVICCFLNPYIYYLWQPINIAGGDCAIRSLSPVQIQPGLRHVRTRSRACEFNDSVHSRLQLLPRSLSKCRLAERVSGDYRNNMHQTA